jgi:hypothetical protein
MRASPRAVAVAVANAIVDDGSRVLMLTVAALLAVTAVVVLRNLARPRSDLPEGWKSDRR